MVSPHHGGVVGPRLSGRAAAHESHARGAVRAPKKRVAAAQSGAVHRATGAAAMLRSLALRRMLWDVALAVSRTASHIVQWVTWRLAHRTHANASHARRRAQATTAQTDIPPTPTAAGAVGAAATTWTAAAPPRAMPESPRHGPASAAATAAILTTVWERLVVHLPAPRRGGGRRIGYDRRRIFDAIVYVVRTDGGWSGLPASFPPWKTVYECYREWRTTGIWNAIWKDTAIPGPLLRE